MNIYLSNCEDFNNNGLGFLKDCLSASVTHEINGTYELNFEYPLNTNMTDYLIEDNIVKCNVGNENYQLFRIKYIQKTFKTIKVNALHIFYDLAANFVEDCAPTSLNAASFGNWVLERTTVANKFKFISSLSGLKSARYVRRNPVECFMGSIENSMLSLFNAEIKRDNFNIEIVDRVGNDNNVKLSIRKNIKEINISIDSSSIYTKVMPVGYNGLLLPEKYVDSPLIDNYVFPKVCKYSFDNIKYEENAEDSYTTLDDAYEALRVATNELYEKGLDKPTINVKIDWVELSKTKEYYEKYYYLEKIDLGDTVHADLLGLTYSARITKTIYNVLTDKIDSFEVGSIKNTINSTLNLVKEEIAKANPVDTLIKAREDATKLITSAMGGFVVKTQNEIFIMDTNDVNTAQKVWRWNLNGLGYSKNGINGPYETAITQDGQIVADFITTGKLNTNVIEGYDSLTLQVKSNTDDLNTTKTNLSNLSNTVDTLSNDIDGVSADFEDFKDNEYIQSIDNLQKQIDGAIQFWNGAEIPTLENYPANQWTTENDKINHQADIYTVVQDVEGEMKQGKSYRFDKIDGVWQWIELTDNELSAVQAIAQEALNKASTNATEIGTIKTDVSELQQTDEQIKASVESIDKQIIPTATATGSHIYVEDASDDPLIQLEIEGKSEQETTQGNQLIDFANPGLKNNVSSTFENNILTISSNGYSSGSNRISFNILDLIKNNPGKIISFSYENLDLSNYTSTASVIVQLQIINNGSNKYPALLTKDGIKTSYTIPNDTSLITTAVLHIYANNTSTYVDSTTVITKPMLQFGTDKLEYEKYTGGNAGPNPNYPSEIESIGYENLFDINRTHTKTSVSTTIINAKLSQRNTGTYCRSNWIIDNLIIGQQYTLNYSYSNPNGSSILTRIYDSTNTTIVKGTSTTTNTSGDEVLIFTATETSHYIRFYSNSTSTSNTYTVEYNNIRLLKGTKQRSYIPYGKYGIEFIHRSKNLLDVSRINSSYNGINYSYNSDGGILVNGTVNTNWSSIIPKHPIKLPLGIYTFSSVNAFSFTTIYLRLYFNDGTSMDITLNKNTLYKTFSIDKQVDYIYLFAGQLTANTIYDEILYFQLEKGSNVTKFNCYFSNSTVLVLDEPPRSLPNGIKDKVYIKNNKLYVDRYVGSDILDGTQEMIYSEPTIGRYDYTIPNAKSKGLCLSNRFIYEFAVNDGKIFLSGAQNNRVSIVNTSKTSIEEINSWLSENNVQVDYELVEPYTEEIGEIEMPSTFKGVNHILTTDELEPTINIEYVRDTTLSSYVEKQIDNVMTIQNRKIGELIVQDDEITQRVSATETNLNNNYMTTDQITAQTDSLKKDINYNTTKMTELSTTIDGVNIKIQTMGAKIENMNYSFQTDALKISTSENKINSKFDNTGVKVYNYELLMAIFNHKGTGVGDLIVTGTAQIGYLKVMKSTKNGKQITAIHHIISEIQSLEDLESDE